MAAMNADMEAVVQHLATEDQKREKKDKRAQQKLTKQLHGELSKNVELLSNYNRVVSLLKRINSQNQDLLDALVLLESEIELPPAPPPANVGSEHEEVLQIIYM